MEHPMDSNAHDFSFDSPRGVTKVVPPGAASSYWQPQPANGYAEVILSSEKLPAVHRFSMGTQLVPPGGTVRLHAHDLGEEVLYILSGRGTATVDGEVLPMTPGTTFYLGHNAMHTFTNDGPEDLSWIWFFMPGGLEEFFSAIGRPRLQGQPAPEPFARPVNVKEIEAATVFKK